MTLIWKSLLHANFRCGRMYSARAEKQTLSLAVRCPLCRECASECDARDRQKALS